MRRSILALALSALCLVLIPAPAHAFFWKWLDDLSGPRFEGFDLEVRLLCTPQKYSDRVVMLETLARKLGEHETRYSEAMVRVRVTSAQGYYQKAIDDIRLAQKSVEAARLDPENLNEVNKNVESALAARARAEAHARNARRVESGLVPRANKDEKLAWAFLPGLSFTACRLNPLDVNRRFMTASVSVARDEKDRHDGAKMFTLGAGYHWRPVHSVTLGAGFGFARFLLESRDHFWKPYFQPLVLDIKPFSLKPDPRFRTPWADTLSFRYTVTTFPGGFNEEKFGVEYPTEFVQAVGVYIDFEPWMRKLQKISW